MTEKENPKSSLPPGRYLIAFRMRDPGDDAERGEWLPRNDRLFTAPEAEAEVERLNGVARAFEFKAVRFDA